MDMICDLDFKGKRGEKWVLVLIADHANERGTGAFPSIERLCKRSEYTRRQLVRLLKNLEEMELLEVERTPGQRNRYRIRMESFQKYGGVIMSPPPINQVSKMSHDPCNDVTSPVTPMSPATKPLLTVNNPGGDFEKTFKLSEIKEKNPDLYEKLITFGKDK